MYVENCYVESTSKKDENCGGAVDCLKPFDDLTGRSRDLGILHVSLQDDNSINDFTLLTQIKSSSRYHVH